LPFNFKGAASVEIGESGDRSFLSFDSAISSDAGQMATGNQKAHRENKEDGLFHVRLLSPVTMQLGPALDSRK
jgi:hypothetical protein